MSRNVSESVDERWGMDELEGEERNAHTVESEPRAGGFGLACGCRLWLSSSGHWSTKEAAPLSTKKMLLCYCVNMGLFFFGYCLNTLNTEEHRRSLWVYFHPGTGQGVGEGPSGTQRNSKPGSEGRDLAPAL